MPTITEIAPNIFRISTYIPEAELQFNQFLVKDEEPLLFHTGLKELFPVVREAVASLIPPSSIRWIAFSHVEADECGAMQEWQQIAPDSTAVCSVIGKIVSVDDFIARRPARGMEDGEVLQTGKFRFRFLQTPHVPHCWDAGLLLEETSRTLFCSDILHQNGDVEALTSSDVVGRFKGSLIEYENSILARYLPYTSYTGTTIQRLAALKPNTLAIMHGSTFSGNCEQALRDYADVLREVLGSTPV